LIGFDFEASGQVNGVHSEALTPFSSLKAEKGKKAAEEKPEASRGWFSKFKHRSQLHNLSP
jgi:hypothetical protein